MSRNGKQQSFPMMNKLTRQLDKKLALLGELALRKQ